MDSYAGHPLVGTAGIPLVVYPGLKVSLSGGMRFLVDGVQLNFLRPKFLRSIKDFVGRAEMDDDLLTGRSSPMLFISSILSG